MIDRSRARAYGNPALAGEAQLGQRQKTRLPFYGSHAWQSLVRSIIAERGRHCEALDCRSPDRGAGGRIYGDHIRELRDGGAPLDRDNIMLLCASCHRSKTLRVASQRNAKPFDDWSGWRGIG
jgi:5-methylcytosine-specific restriction protein A